MAVPVGVAAAAGPQRRQWTARRMQSSGSYVGDCSHWLLIENSLWFLGIFFHQTIRDDRSSRGQMSMRVPFESVVDVLYLFSFVGEPAHSGRSGCVSISWAAYVSTCRLVATERFLSLSLSVMLGRIRLCRTWRFARPLFWFEKMGSAAAASAFLFLSSLAAR